MNGLLDFIKTPAGQGLLSAAFGGLAGARRGTPLNNIGRAGIAGLTGYGSAQDRITQEAEAAQARELRAMQTAKYKRDMTADETAANEKQRVEDLIRTTFLPVTGTNANARTGITGPRPEAAEAIGSTPAVDWQQMIAMGVPFERVKQLAESKNLGRNKVARTVKGMGEDGREFEYQVDDYGQRVGEGLAQYRAPIQVNQGDRQTFADAYTLKPVGQFGINQSADSRASQATAMRGQNMTDSRARERMAFDKAGGGEFGGDQIVLAKQYGKPPTGYRWKPDGSMEAVPGGPADIKAGELGDKRARQKQGAVQQADRIIAKVDQAVSKVGLNTAGMGGSMLSRVPGTEAKNLQTDLETIKANLGFAELQAMREASPTGGALGAIAVQELIALQSTVASLDQAQGPAQLKARLGEVRKHYENWKNAVDGGASAGGSSVGWEPAGKNSAISSGGWSATLKK